MFDFKVILFYLASLSTLQAAHKCGVPKHYFSIDKSGATNCGSSCEATVIFSGYREANAEYVTIDMITDHYESNKFMTLQFWYDNKSHNLNCTSKTVYRKKSADGLQCNWKLELSGNLEYPITNRTILSDLLVNEKVTNEIYFGLNGRRSLVATSLTHLIPYHESFPDCTEYDVITFYDPQQLNKITLSKKRDSITGFIYSLKNDTQLVDRSIRFTNSDKVEFIVTCTNSFKTSSHYLTQYGWNDWTVDVSWTKFTGLPGVMKCGFSVPLKIYTSEYGYCFDFNKKPITMAFNTTQPNASFYQPNIKFKFN